MFLSIHFLKNGSSISYLSLRMRKPFLLKRNKALVIVLVGWFLSCAGLLPSQILTITFFYCSCSIVG